ncbi:sulfhydryl oxidase 2 [Venturia canescens]|uniref:sulfhydryl oxidase 2 n=1 Tax=Venturia canescens TaxID=32260 RepID=UPI001C9D6204|nr:sulfhydryl oxidase 2 [Venturia canescens]
MSRCCPRIFCFLEALLLLIFAVDQVVPSVIGRLPSSPAPDSYQSLSLNQGLYNSSDHVVVLNSTNFKSTVYGSEHAWLVEFYNSWCGFCQRFAPTWKALAHETRGWKNVVTIAALNCADEDNNPLCREYEIMRYPEVRYFAPHENPLKLGADVEKGKDLAALLGNLLAKLRKEQQEERGANWPNITPFRSSEVKNIWEGIAPEAKYYFFIFEEPDSYLGMELILDFRDEKSLTIRSVTSDNSLLCLMHKIIRFPSIIVYDREMVQTRLALRVPTREGARKVIEEFMQLRGLEIHLEEVELEEEILEKPVVESKSNRSSKKWKDDSLYQADLEAALRFSLNHEIPLTKLIKGEKMQALKNFTSVLASYFPVKHGNPMFLGTISFVVRSKDEIRGEDFATLVSSTEQEMSPVYSEENKWIGCKPSKPGLRGYSCGLWTLFHTMSVSLAAKSEEHPDLEPTQVLGAMHGYIKNFFGCADCAQHFVAMAGKNKIFDVATANEGILWLWRAHNEVNQRLAGDATEDPEHPKVQYPTAEHCPQCRDDNDRWNETNVLAYLKKKYFYSAIKYTGSTRSLSFEKNLSDPKLRDERLASYGERVATSKKFSWDFTIFDISICVVLYIASAAILILVCVKFAVKRSYKKRMYIHSILGKV